MSPTEVVVKRVFYCERLILSAIITFCGSCEMRFLLPHVSNPHLKQALTDTLLYTNFSFKQASKHRIRHISLQNTLTHFNEHKWWWWYIAMWFHCFRLNHNVRVSNEDNEICMESATMSQNNEIIMQ